MKQSKYYVLFVFLLSYAFLGTEVKAQKDSTEVKTKKGWSTGVLPALGYDSNLGFMYGGILSLFDYGDGSRYPDYFNNVYLQLSAYTKGSMDAILYYESFSLVPNKRFIGRLSYNRNQAYPFYGFNGKESVYNADFEDQDHNDYISRVFYRYDRHLLKGDFLLQDRIAETNFSWMAGLDLSYYKTATVDVDKLNEGENEEDKLPKVPTLYDKYLDAGFISEEEKDGGFDNSIKLALVYDTRDRLTNPMKGMWTELIVRAAPKWIGNDTDHGRIALIHRHYITLSKEKLSFAYRLWYEAALGDQPFYSMAHLTSSNYYEGFGGAANIRGILMNRVVGCQVTSANLELRWKALPFRALKQNFYLGMNAFYDAGAILQPYKLNENSFSDADRTKFFNNEDQGMFSTVGAGLKLVMNENFVISADYGVSLDEAYGNSGMYVLVGYLF